LEAQAKKEEEARAREEARVLAQKKRLDDLEADRARARAEGLLSEETRKVLVSKLKLENQPPGNGFGALTSREEILHNKGTANDLLCCFIKSVCESFCFSWNVFN
jgi:hypothetical protein